MPAVPQVAPTSLAMLHTLGIEQRALYHQHRPQEPKNAVERRGFIAPHHGNNQSIRYGASIVGIEHGQLQPAFLLHLDLSLVRWVLIQRLLDHIGLQYNHVLMVDVGDTFFQANPFDIIGDPGRRTRRGRVFGNVLTFPSVTPWLYQ